MTLFPGGPVAVTLDPRQTQTIEFESGREKGDDFEFTDFWKIEISDVALLDPIPPNTASGSCSEISTLEDLAGEAALSPQRPIDPT